jgi:2-(1,2-epoxy-1,2-dihydrophenyl)acetyl-CoA isomerase
MAYETILTEVEDGVGVVTLNRPDVMNAMNRQLSRGLHRRDWCGRTRVLCRRRHP